MYEGDDAEGARHAYRAAGANFDIAWAARPFNRADDTSVEASAT